MALEVWEVLLQIRARSIAWPWWVGRAYDCGVEGSMRRWVVTNRRRALRHAVQISCQVVRERDFRLVGDRIVDLSTSGMLVTPADPVLTGERIIASFRLPNSTYWIDVDATVARVVHGRRASAHRRGVV